MYKPLYTRPLIRVGIRIKPIQVHVNGEKTRRLLALIFIQCQVIHVCLLLTMCSSKQSHEQYQLVGYNYYIIIIVACTSV